MLPRKWLDGVGISFLGVSLLAVSLLATAACGQDDENARFGALGLRLRTETGDDVYRLNRAHFDLTGPEVLTLSTEDEPNTDSIRASLGVGDYQINLRSGWRLEREFAMGFSPVAATLTSPNPSDFSIIESQTTSVVFAFETDGRVVSFGEGEVNLTIQVTEGSPGCGLGSEPAAEGPCRCLVGAVEPCEEHPGLDGLGACRAGARQCLPAPDGQGSDWGACLGSLGPQPFDSCQIWGDDADCDGVPNGGCVCVEEQLVACGPSEVGTCRSGISTCVNGQFTECLGAVFPRPRDCTSSADNDCDGLADNLLDVVCQCVPGSVHSCEEHPGLDGVGPCRAGLRLCEAGPNNATSAFGACVGSVGPAPRDSCTQAGDDANCDGIPNGDCPE